jgi:hypothetical protein
MACQGDAGLVLTSLCEKMWLDEERSTSQNIFGDGCVFKIRSSWLQKSPSSNSGERRENSPDISMGFFQLGMLEFDPSQVSQPLTQLEIVSAL